MSRLGGWDIIDARGPARRAADALWRRAAAGPAWARLGERLTSPLLATALRLRVRRRGLPPPRPLIVSVGNLALGGTGKTPVICALAADLAARGVRGAVVTRGHPSRLRGPLLVDPACTLAGDEARLLAARLPGWPVVQARDRLAGMARVRRLEPPPEIVLLEDAHQSAGVPRHMDILLLDRWRCGEGTGGRIVPLAGPVVPWGPYREGAAGAGRAHVWMVELADVDSACPAGGEFDPAVAAFSRRLRLERPPPPGQAYAVISGIARPEAFEMGCARLLGRSPCLAVRADDHAAYRPAEVAGWLEAGRGRGAGCWLTTAKDALKLAALWPEDPPLRTVELDIVWAGKRTLPDLVGERLPHRGPA